MSSLSDDYENRVNAMVNTRLADETKDFGTITDYFVITEGSSRRYVFVTDTGRKIDSGSAMRFMRAYRRRMENAIRNDEDKLAEIVFPEGTTTALRRRAMRVRRSGSMSLFGETISNVAKIGNEYIGITSHSSSSDEFEEESEETYSEKVQEARKEIYGV